MRLRRLVRRGGSSGALLLEALLGLTMGVVVLGSLVALLTGGLRWVRSLVEHAEALEVVRTSWVVLDEELRPGQMGRDWRVDETGALVLRAFRGVARLCDSDPSGSGGTVGHTGRRAPDPTRDSLLVLVPDGSWKVVALASSVPSGSCSFLPGESSYRWSWSSATLGRPLLLRNFETGSYHLEDGALRYRRGAGGRQPLTPERLSDRSGFRASDGSLEVTLDLTPDSRGSLPGPFVWEVRPALAPK